MRLEIDGRDAGIKFSACHLIPGHEKCGRLHGHAYIIRMVLHGEKGERAMVMDFVPLKKALRDIADELDHHVLLPGNCPSMKIKVGEEIAVKVKGKSYLFPVEDVIILDAEESSAEEIARVILEMVLQKVRFPKNVSSIEIGVDEELGQSAWVSRDLRC
ncbi:MAG: 6-carboxytetrahydropterin synthase [Methanomassiliicoccales archaeon]|jgi:6-pyruvoyltetrahydropterin/6-carboxytetrahydropterin synthase|nr:6-carboxytetrahydropterin synthase [Methanomassiliicoccales archaeon]MDD1756574.1 6-carboxytetrahydropterin synthase [Methanomassiliicoccales archaeon]